MLNAWEYDLLSREYDLLIREYDLLIREYDLLVDNVCEGGAGGNGGVDANLLAHRLTLLLGHCRRDRPEHNNNKK